MAQGWSCIAIQMLCRRNGVQEEMRGCSFEYRAVTLCGRGSCVSNKMWMANKKWEESWYFNYRVGDIKDRVDMIDKVGDAEEESREMVRTK